VQKELSNVSVEATTKEVTLRGNIPKGKMAEAVRIATEIGKRRINNQLTEQ
jgi:osmotically-inducible protein OsmY